jgi:hypothetical protein
MASLDELREAYEAADAKAIALSGEYHEKSQDAVRKLKDRYHDRIWKANAEAAEAQKAYNDAQAAAALVGREDAELVAERLGLTLPDA